MVSAEQFIELLEEKDLLPSELLQDLRERVAHSMTPVTAALIAKRLVDKGHLSRMLAQRLLDQAEEGLPPAGRRAAQPATDEDDLGLAPLEEEEQNDFADTEEEDWGLDIIDKPPPKPAQKQPAKGKPRPSRPTAKPIKKATAKPTKKAAAKPIKKPAAKAPAKKARPIAPAPASGSLLDEELSAEGQIDGLLDDSAFGADVTQGPLDADGPKRRGLFSPRRGRKRVGQKSVWDSKLLLFGGGGLLVLLILLVVFLWALGGRKPEEILQQANDYYREGSYTKAVDSFTQYLDAYSDSPGAGEARVKLGLSRIRQATVGGSDWRAALEVVSEELPGITGEEEFQSEARPELASILPDVADGLAQKARADLDSHLVDLSADALALVEKYVARSSQPVTRLNDVRALLDLTRREISRGEKLLETIAAMEQTTASGDTGGAYQSRRDLLKEYPTLIDDESLTEAVLAVSQAEREVVEVVQERKPAETTDAPPRTLASVTLASRTAKSQAPGAEGYVIFARAEGAVYGLDGASGKVLWRREVGFGTDGRSVSFPPTPVANAPRSDLLLVDTQAQAVLRVEAATGRLRWRFPVGERFDAHPVVAADRLLVATRSGRLLTVDLDSGDSSEYIQLPQSLRTAPAVDSRRDNIYQIAEHSTLFVLSLTSGQAKQVVYLGHEPGSVVTAPVVIDRFLIVAENDGIENATLKVLSLESEGEEPSIRLLQEVPVDGHFQTSPRVSGPRLLATTDQGDIYVFEISGADPKEPLKRVAHGKVADDILVDKDVQLVRFPYLAGGQVWVADSQLARYDVYASRGRLQPKWMQASGSPTLQPPRTIGQTIYHVRHKLKLPGVSVSALSVEEGELIWETQLAVSLVTEPTVEPNSGRITATTSLGAVFQIDAADAQGHTVNDQPAAALPPAHVRKPLTDVLPLGGNSLALVTTEGFSELPIFDPAAAGTKIRRLSLTDPVACRPTIFSGGLLVPLTSGQAVLLDPRSGAKRAEPFQPRLETDRQVDWQEAVPYGESELLLTDGVAGLYRIGIQDQPKPHLVALATHELAEPIVSPIAVLESTVYAVDRSLSLVSFKLPDLTPGGPRPLSGRCVWGPRKVGEYVLLATEDQTLYSIGADGKIGTTPLPYGPLAGAPLALDGHHVLASTRGVIWRVDLATGNELGKVDTGLPLGTGPVLLGERLLVGGHDGSLYQIEKP